MALSTVSPRNMSCQNPNTCTLKALSYQSQQRVIEALGLLGVIDWNPNCVKPAKTSSCYPLPFRWNSPVFQLWCGEHNGVKYGQMHSSFLFPVLIPVVIRLVLTGINLLPWCHRRWPRWLQCFASRHGFSGILWWWSGCTMLDPNGSETYWSSLGWFRTRWNRERKCLQWFFFSRFSRKSGSPIVKTTRDCPDALYDSIGLVSLTRQAAQAAECPCRFRNMSQQ